MIGTLVMAAMCCERKRKKDRGKREKQAKEMPGEIVERCVKLATLDTLVAVRRTCKSLRVRTDQFLGDLAVTLAHEIGVEFLPEAGEENWFRRLEGQWDGYGYKCEWKRGHRPLAPEGIAMLAELRVIEREKSPPAAERNKQDGQWTELRGPRGMTWKQVKQVVDQVCKLGGGGLMSIVGSSPKKRLLLTTLAVCAVCCRGNSSLDLCASPGPLPKGAVRLAWGKGMCVGISAHVDGPGPLPKGAEDNDHE